MAVSSVAQIDPLFLAVVTEIANTSATNGNAATGAGSRVWQYPPLAKWKGDPSDLAGMVSAFDRSAANQIYAKAISDPTSPGTVGDLVAMKTQIDYVGVLERGFRARLASPVRCLVHAAGRRIGHGDPAGVFLGGVVSYAQDVVTSAKSAPV